jgi:hypothetical protein
MKLRWGEARPRKLTGQVLRLHLISESSCMPIPTYDELFNPLLQATASLPVQPSLSDLLHRSCQAAPIPRSLRNHIAKPLFAQHAGADGDQLFSCGALFGLP